MDATIKRGSLSQEAYARLHKDICSGKFEQGALLSESSIAAELGMSRTPVREALRRLAAEGLVEIRNGVGTIVNTLSYTDLLDLTELRIALEPLAARTAVFNITAEETADLINRFVDLRSRWLQNDPSARPEQFSELDHELHDLLVSRSRNKFVRNILQGINVNIRRYQDYVYSNKLGVEESTEQHLHILQAIEQQDAATVTERLSEHLVWSSKFWKTL